MSEKVIKPSNIKTIFIMFLTILIIFSIVFFTKTKVEHVDYVFYKNNLSFEKNEIHEKLESKPEKTSDENRDREIIERQIFLRKLRISAKDSEAFGYQHYDDESLLRLAYTGDLLAIREITFRKKIEFLMSEPGDERVALLEELHQWQHKSIIHGDQWLLPFTPDEATLFIALQDSETEKKRKSALVEFLAQYEFAALRGNTLVKYEYLAAWIPVLRQHSEIKIDQEMKDSISMRARMIFEQYEKERLALGLGSFDNTYPVELDPEIASARAHYLDVMGAEAF